MVPPYFLHALHCHPLHARPATWLPWVSSTDILRVVPAPERACGCGGTTWRNQQRYHAIAQTSSIHTAHTQQTLASALGRVHPPK